MATAKKSKTAPKKSKKAPPKKKKSFVEKNSLALVSGALFVLLIAGCLIFFFSKMASTRVILSPESSQKARNTVIYASKSAKLKAPVVASKSAVPVSDIPYSTGKSVRVPILMYHYIGNNPNPADKARDILSTAPDIFDSQLGYLAKNGFTPITFDTMYAGLEGQVALPPKPIILTFDDGYIDFYVNAFPILRKYGFHAVSFIPTGLINQGYYLSWAQIKEMQSSGLISF